MGSQLNYKNGRENSGYNTYFARNPPNFQVYQSNCSTPAVPGYQCMVIPNDQFNATGIAIPANGRERPTSSKSWRPLHSKWAGLSAIQPQAVSSANSSSVEMPRSLYEDVDRRKLSGHTFKQPPHMSYAPEKYPTLNDISVQLGTGVPPNLNRDKENSFVNPMRSFMSTHEPTTSVQFKSGGGDWSPEAQALLDEFARLGRPQGTSFISSWPDPKKIAVSEVEDTCLLPGIPKNKDKDETLTGSSSEEVYSINNESSQMRIHRHFQGMKPSPYPGASPGSSGLSSISSRHSSDEEADDETTFSRSRLVRTKDSAYSSRTSTPDLEKSIAKGPIGHQLKSRFTDQDSVKSALHYAESGYFSSSDGGSVFSAGRRGSQSTTSGLDSDEAISECSSRPISPMARPTSISEFGAVSPTHVDPYVSNMLAAPWLQAPLPEQLLLRHMPSRQALPEDLFPSVLSSEPIRNYYVTPQQGPVQVSMAPSSGEGRENYQKHKKWITEDILEMIALRDRLYKRMKKHPTPDVVDMYKKVRNMVVGMTRNAKRAYEKKMEASRKGNAGAYTYRAFHSAPGFRAAGYKKK